MLYLVNSCETNRLPKINYMNQAFHTPVSVATAFNDHLATIADTLAGEIPVIDKSPLDYLGDPIQT